MLEQIIENLDLNEKEAKVYLAGLKKGKSKVSEIAKEAGLNRITAYEILKKLSSKGLAGGFTYGGITYFQVIDPDIFLSKKERQLLLAKDLLPQLSALKNSAANKPQIDFYSGAEGIKAVYEDTLTCKNKIIYNITNIQNLTKVLDDAFLENYFQRRTRKKIRVKVLIPKEGLNKKYLADNEKYLRETKIFDSERFNIPNEILIYDNKVAILSFSAKIGVVIQDQEIAASMQSIWQLLWSSPPSHPNPLPQGAREKMGES